MSNIDKHGLLGVPKHANQHRLSRLTMEVHTDELRIMASEVESYTDELIAALEDAGKRIADSKTAQQTALIYTAEVENQLEDALARIAELEAKLANPVVLPKTNGYWTEQEKAYEEAITLAKRQVRLAGFRCEGDE
ncbi:hypothetical protein HCH06_17930 [Enterobacter ludwigii]|uniref:hypothetical protein n=1 Tax=Enterobacter ludwigii TaxID=299767 RepID=UPI001C8B7500|nr:hypothetical protein [Enterobacter ludwigii]MBX9031242.1 hypothetical protein [Enterobacter ludwigii]